MGVLKREYTRERKVLTLISLLHYNVFFIFSPFKSTRFSPRVFLIFRIEEAKKEEYRRDSKAVERGI